MSFLAQERFFVAARALLVLIAPAAFFWRERVFEDHGDDKYIPPAKYLVGMISA